MTPDQAAWKAYHALGLSTDKPVGLMNALLDVLAQQHALRAAIRAYVRTDPESHARILAFGAMVKMMEEGETANGNS